MKLNLVFAGVGAMVLGLNYAMASTTDATALVSKLNHIQTLQADFVQTVTQKGSDMPSRSSGQIVLKKPDHIKWQVDKPEKQVYLTDGKSLWHLDYFLEQETVQPLQKKFSSTPILLLSNDASGLTQQFSVHRQGEQFTLTPKQKGEGVDSVKLGFQGEKLNRLTVVNTLNQTTTVTFNHIRLNKTVENGVFMLKTPKGFSVLDSR